MYNFTTNTYEMKRDILNFSEKISKGLSKSKEKFVSDMIYGIEKSGSILFSNVARALDEPIKLKNAIERLCDNCNSLSETEFKTIKDNYMDIAISKLPDDEIILIEDDSDVNKEYRKKLEEVREELGKSKNQTEVIRQYKDIQKLDYVTVQALIDYIEIGGSRNNRIINIHWNL